MTEISHRLNVRREWENTFPEIRLNLSQEGDILVIRKSVRFQGAYDLQRTISTESVSHLLLKAVEEDRAFIEAFSHRV